jgi:hypothetical protein
MSSFMAFGSRQISLAESSRSSFALVVSYLCVGKDLPPSSIPMKAGFPTGTHRCRLSDRGECTYHEGNRFYKL